MMNASAAPNAAIVLLSGGLDSTVALAETMAVRPVVRVLSVHYGQRAWPNELAAATAITQFYGLPHEVLSLPVLAHRLPAAMTPKDHLSAPESTEADIWDTRTVWVPNRNGVLLNLAAAVAEAEGAKYIVFGANADEAEGFPDNTPEYRQALTKALAYSTLNQVEVLAPVEHLTKAEIVARGKALCAPLHLTWSCYEAGEQPCNACASCIRAAQAFSQ